MADTVYKIRLGQLGMILLFTAVNVAHDVMCRAQYRFGAAEEKEWPGRVINHSRFGGGRDNGAAMVRTRNAERTADDWFIAASIICRRTVRTNIYLYINCEFIIISHCLANYTLAITDT